MPATKREKLFHAIVFFVENTKQCHKLKLYKLLYFLDFEIFRQTGKPTTGLLYFAWPMGPVPRQLHTEFRAPPVDMQSALAVRGDPGDDPGTEGRLRITPRVKFDESHFTKRESREMERLAEIFRDATSEQMTLASHAAGLPWRHTYIVEKQQQALIPYALALRDDRPGTISKERADEIALEERAALALFK